MESASGMHVSRAASSVILHLASKHVHDMMSVDHQDLIGMACEALSQQPHCANLYIVLMADVCTDDMLHSLVVSWTFSGLIAMPGQHVVQKVARLHQCVLLMFAYMQVVSITRLCRCAISLLLLHGSTSSGMPCRCHRCILAARSDYFRAFLERSPAQLPSYDPSSADSAQARQTKNATEASSHADLSQGAAANEAATAAEPAATAAESLHRRASQQNASWQAAGQHEGSTVDAGQPSSGADPEQSRLPKLVVSDVTPQVFQLVLEFAYSGSIQILAPHWLKAAGAELLFEAAERYLLSLLKVSIMPQCFSLNAHLLVKQAGRLHFVTLSPDSECSQLAWCSNAAQHEALMLYTMAHCLTAIHCMALKLTHDRCPSNKASVLVYVGLSDWVNWIL